MALGTSNGWNEMDVLRRDLDRFFDTCFRRSALPSAAFLPGRAARAYPRLNLSEDETNYYVEALAPGIDPESIKASMQNNELTLEGEKKAAQGDLKPADYHRSERSAGRFTRRLTLPEEVDAERVVARYEQGILKVTLPKSEAARPRRIDVKVA